MRLRFVVVGILLAMCLSGCDLSPGNVSTPGLDQVTRDQMASDCLDLWINTDAPQTTIDAGLVVTSPDGKPIAEPAVILGSDGRYHVNLTSDDFTEWVTADNVPQEHITASTLYGQACPYDSTATAIAIPSGG